MQENLKKKSGSKKSSHCAQFRRPLSYPNFLNKSHKKKRFGSSHYKSGMNALKSDNLQYNTLVRWISGTNDSSTKHYFFHNFL